MERILRWTRGTRPLAIMPARAAPKKRRITDISADACYTNDAERARRGVERDASGAPREFDFNTLAATLMRRDVAAALVAMSRPTSDALPSEDSAFVQSYSKTMLAFRDAVTGVREMNARLGELGFAESSFDACDYDYENFEALATWLLEVYRARAA